MREAKKDAEDRSKQKAPAEERSAQGVVSVPPWVQNRGLPEFRFQSMAVLLTYQKFPDTSVWERFVPFVTKQLLNQIETPGG